MAHWSGTGFHNGIDAPGSVARILAAPDVQRPNGIQVSPDDKTLYLIEANQAQGGARLIRAYDLQPDGGATRVRSRGRPRDRFRPAS